MIGILGLSDREVPECDCWTMVRDPLVWGASRVFEMHPVSVLAEHQDNSYFERIREIDAPVYALDPTIPARARVAYPLQEAIGLGGDYFTSTIAYMIALAVLENREFGLFGVGLTDPEYADQQHCIEYWLGVARGRGVRFHLPESSPFLKMTKHRAVYPVRYGCLQ